MKYWKEHEGLRLALMVIFFVVGLALVIGGWKMTGQLGGLGLMLIGVALLLATLWLYNTRFADERQKKTK